MEVRFISHSGAKAGEPNAYELVWEGGRILLDCGAGAGAPKYLEKMEAPDLVWVSHAHGDHCGALLGVKERFPEAKVAATAETAALLGEMLGGKKGNRLQARVEGVVRGIRRLGKERFEEIAGLKGLRVMALKAGHVPGAAMLLAEIGGGEKRVLYTGDFCTHRQLTVAGAGAPKLADGKEVDLLVMESMLGADKEGDQWDREEAAEGLRREIGEAKGAVLIGVSSLGEAGEMASLLASEKVVMVDEYLRGILEIAPGEDSEIWKKLRFGDRRQLQRHLEVGGVVIAVGDQYQRGSAAAFLAGGILEDEGATILVLNRARKKTGAGRLLEAAKKDGRLRWWDRKAELRARVVHHRWINHAPRWQLVGFAQLLKPKKILLVHGSTGARWALKRAMEQAGVEAEIVVVANQEAVLV